MRDRPESIQSPKQHEQKKLERKNVGTNTHKSKPNGYK
jgi:hypothetical protein